MNCKKTILFFYPRYLNLYGTGLAILFCLMSFLGISQTSNIPDISADRPGMSTPPALAEPKTVQVETGFSYEQSHLDNSFRETILYNTTLLRFGINKNFEIRLHTDFAGVRTDSLTVTGFNPLGIGTKVLLFEHKGILPRTSFLFNLTLPWIGKKEFRPSNLAPSFYLLMQNNIGEKFSICYNVGLEYDGETVTPREFAAVCLGYGLTEKLNVFVESYNWFYTNSGPGNFADFGLAWLPRHNLQFDISGNVSFREISKYRMISFGVAWRIPD